MPESATESPPLPGSTGPSLNGRTGWCGCALTRVLNSYVPIRGSQSCCTGSNFLNRECRRPSADVSTETGETPIPQRWACHDHKKLVWHPDCGSDLAEFTRDLAPERAGILTDIHLTEQAERHNAV